ncbi:MAG: alpha-D-glucose phosphate-specific phosphoglucomutase [Gammaproteobacteria bacterium]|nr:alpha-D-glucose phosphate-specific phosphoglucomutase [Gammaproteobacteria bacterium]MDE2345263.1 alpha-D-glucose phosphate-specific phosphoglucomutase [Gammaproteobacteria bacterium]
MKIATVSTRPFIDQNPGTAGLRKSVRAFQQPHYLENYIQACFDAIPSLISGTLVIGGDGRYFNREAIGTLLKMAAANGVKKSIIGRGGLLSTPAASMLITHLRAAGGFIFTASHNPGGQQGDFGIKLNLANGGQATEANCNSIYQRSRAITHYRMLDVTSAIDLNRIGSQQLGSMSIEIIDPIAHYAGVMENLFDFEIIRALLRSATFQMHFDAMHAVTGPYAVEIFEKRLGARPGTVIHGTPMEDFAGVHPDPNPLEMPGLIKLFSAEDSPDFGAASDGDGDRNMIIGRKMLVSPGDSLAVLTANAHLVPGYASGLIGVARSMPTSHAVDRVAEKLGIPCYETPTGWRFFCNLLDAGKVSLCGEESFGTGSNHAREKDGLWAILFWLNLIAVRSENVGMILTRHWQEYGRDFFQREDYYISDAAQAQALMRLLSSRVGGLPDETVAGVTVRNAENFTYHDPVDGSISHNQGIWVTTAGGGRIVYRLSGTGTRGATLRIYLEQYLPDAAQHSQTRSAVLAPLSRMAQSLARLDTQGIQSPSAVI